MKKFALPLALLALTQSSPAQAELLDIEANRTVETYTLTASTIQISGSTQMFVNPNGTLTALNPKFLFNGRSMHISDDGARGDAAEYFCALLDKEQVGYKVDGPYRESVESVAIDGGMISSIQRGGYIYASVTCN